MQPRQHLFTSESVSMGHPDKAADQVSDAILDAVLEQDADARVACEVLLTDGLAVVAGEISAEVDVDYEGIVRETMRSIGYDRAEVGFDAGAAEVRVAIHEQSQDIARGVDGDDLGAGDQGLMFGYAIADTPELMPLPITLANGIIAAQAAARSSEAIPHLRPDAKSQVSVVYERGAPQRIASIVLSTQHGPEWNDDQERLQKAATEHILRPALGDWWSDDIEIHVNPTGRFEKGGPAGDTGLTGRKIIVDTYGGWARHGGGAFSGKDPSKVDRSASYMARHIAKAIVAAGLARECEVRLGYAIGVPRPTAVTVDCRGTTDFDEEAIERAVMEVFPLTPTGIIEALGLRRPIYRPTSYHGHFGRTPDDPPGAFSWERIDKVEALRQALGVSASA
ncbi:MAG TPA: methionine adenosyltransferase [Acidimicrobiia bacterium]|nr:methionine adenosyltransferase [Acidimicrobiia bacterium]